MRCYTFNKYRLIPNIRLTHAKQENKYFLLIGHPKGTMHKIPLFLKNPPVIMHDRYITQAHPVRVEIQNTKNNKTIWTLACPRNPDDSRCLIRINTKHTFTVPEANAQGQIIIKEGRPVILAEGELPGHFKDYLLIFHERDVIAVQFEGFDKPSHIIKYDLDKKGLIVINEREAQTR